MWLAIRAGVVFTALVAVIAPTAEARPGERRVSYSLPNGLRVRLVPDRDVDEVVVLLGVRGGFFAEPAGRPHLAHVAEHLITLGASNGSEEAKDVARWFAGGRANAETLAHCMYFDLRVRPEDLPRALRLQAARLTRPEFTPELLRQEVPRTLAELEHLERSALGGTGKFALSGFAQASLHGQSQILLREATHKLTVADIQDYWSRTSRPDRAILNVIGNFDSKVAREAIAKSFGTIPEPGARPAGDEQVPRSCSSTWDVKTQHLLIAWKVPPPSDPDHSALTLATLPLMERLQADPGLLRLARMPHATNEVDGLFILNAQVKPGADLKALEAQLLDQVQRLGQREGIGAAELARARTWLMPSLRPESLVEGSRPLGVPRILVQANLELQVMIREMAWGDLPSYAARVEAVSLDTARAAVSKHLNRRQAVIVRIAPSREL